ncbi:hypothetical protein AOCH_005226, partial [Aspergillus ochraceoroseus]
MSSVVGQNPRKVESIDKVALLQQRLNNIEVTHREEIQQIRSSVERLAAQLESSTVVTEPAIVNKDHAGPHCADIVQSGILSEGEWEELYHFFRENCYNVIGFMDDELYKTQSFVRQHPLTSTAICVIAARAIRQERYQTYLAHAHELIKNTFVGPTPDIHAVRAMMLLTAWTGQSRLWGYIGSVSTELGLNTAALQLGDEAVAHTADLVQRARTWFTLCCFDLTYARSHARSHASNVLHLNRPFVINRMRDYLPFAKRLLTSPYTQPVDHRICAYIVGFTITADAKAQLPKSGLQLNPMPQEAIQLLESFDQSIDRWFHKINNTIEPVYQTFVDKQDRNRFLIPYTFMKIYINGFALHGMDGSENLPDLNRISFVQKALNNAHLLIQTQCRSQGIRRRFKYTIDYIGTTTYHAINLILKALSCAHQYLDYEESFMALHQATILLEEAGAVEAAKEVRREHERLALLTQTAMSSTEEHFAPEPTAIDDENLFDIPSFLNAA